MINLIYIFLGIASGIICSVLAKKYQKSQKDWYMLGQIFPLISLFIFYIFFKKSTNAL